MDVAAAKPAKPRPNMRNVGHSTERPSQGCGCGGCQLPRPSVVVVVVLSPVRPPRGSVFSHPRAAATAATVTASTRHPGPGSRMGTGATAASAPSGAAAGGWAPPRGFSAPHAHTHSGTAHQTPVDAGPAFFFNRSRIAAGAPPAAPCIFLFFLLVLFFSLPPRPTARRCPVQTLRRRCPFP